MKKHLHLALTSVLIISAASSLYAQYNPANNTIQSSTTAFLNIVSPPPPVFTGTGITCEGSTFWSINGMGQIHQYSLAGNNINNSGFVTTAGAGRSLAFCNNLNGGSFSPTFYTSSIAAFNASYFNGANWTTANGISSDSLYNCAGNGNYLYFLSMHSGLSKISKYDAGSFQTIYADATLKVSVAGLGVDDLGNVFCFRGASFDTATYLDVISPNGVLLKRYNVSLNSYHAYGCFLMNGILYVGMGSANVYHPNSLVPFSFTPDSVTKGIPIQMPYGNFYELASCSPGIPFIQYPLTVQVSSTPVRCDAAASGTATTLPVGGIAPYSFAWSTGETTSAILNLTGNTYFVTVTDAAGTTVSNSVTIAGASNPSVLIAADKTSFCAGDSAYLCATTAGNCNYLWSTGETTECILATHSGNYYVTVTDAYNCSAESIPVSLNVYPPPSVSISMSGDTLQAYNAISYQWYVGGVKIISATAPTFVPNTPGIYLVQITDSAGCSASSNPVVIASAQNLFEEQYQFQITPNPANDLLFIKTNYTKPAQVSILDNNGRKVLASTLAESVQVSELAAGFYFVEIKTDRYVVRRKFLKK